METVTVPYEFHVTVEAGQTPVDRFRELCQELGAKAIVLDLGVNSGRKLEDYMTSSRGMLPSDQAAFDEVERIAVGLAEHGCHVIRKKIETAPWHPAAPQDDATPMPAGSYFEAHLATRVDEQKVSDLRDFVLAHTTETPLHLSRNAFKQAVDGELVMMATLRHYEGGYPTFRAAVEQAIDVLASGGYELEKTPITEFALYDTNVHQDDAWMKR
ncbi:MAG TPA: hypothetical protein VG992_04315 [Candidatus Saccharimonadales bacterium]|nr:hypothetical protein [Candidatus Saccharimonadales bacterium]